MKKIPLLLVLSLALAACGQDPVTPPQPPLPPLPPISTVPGNTVQGSLAGWPYAAAQLRVDLLAGEREAPTIPAAIAASGAVNAVLPNPTLQNSLFDGCTFGGGLNPDGVRVDIGALKVFSAQNDLLGAVFERTPEDQLLMRLYASSAVTLKGSALCDGDRLNFDLVAAAGWNLIRVDLTADGALSFSTAPAGVQSRLFFGRADEAVVVVPDSRVPLTIRRGQSVDVPVKLYQVGGASGTVDLVSGRPGLEITPAQVTLPAGAGMQAQALSRPARYTLRSALPASWWVGMPQRGPLAQNLRAQALSTTLKVAAQPWGPTDTGPLPILVRRGGQPLGGGSLPSVSVVAPTVIAYGRFSEVTQGEGGTLELNIYPQGYRGAVTVTAQGLPAGVTAAAQTVTITGSEPVTVLLAVTVPAGQAVGHFPVTLVTTEQPSGLDVSSRTLLTVASPRVRLAQGGSNRALDGAGNLWTSGMLGLVRHRADGTHTAFAPTGYNCGAMTLGDDGGIWQMSAPQVRYDAVTGEGRVMNDPRGFSGCAGWGMRFDAQGRGWDTYDGIQRLDYAQNRAEKVPGSSYDHHLLDVEGSSVWASSFMDGGAQLVHIDSNTLARQTFALPGATIVNKGYAAGGKVWLPNNLPGRLVSFDPATGSVASTEVRVNGQLETEFNVLGVDAQGRHWLEFVRVSGEINYRDWVLYDPATASVVRQVPGFYPVGSGEPALVAPDGTLWALNSSQGAQSYDYAHIYRP
ncbi:hypothetical protein [Deinococcus sp. QL22]|uniref:hypothetical protein n=1 Tax=Deinococcus sp. QL22 TaxID=2939437 RepID=UPI002018153D|nr:hypothetical protein [Deinococcus sp. QL22]UQN06532.1 hypothetical protein M1R55_01020 [Deinococcus sp. QL22]